MEVNAHMTICYILNVGFTIGTPTNKAECLTSIYEDMKIICITELRKISQYPGDISGRIYNKRVSERIVHNILTMKLY